MKKKKAIKKLVSLGFRPTKCNKTGNSYMINNDYNWKHVILDFDAFKQKYIYYHSQTLFNNRKIAILFETYKELFEYIESDL